MGKALVVAGLVVAGVGALIMLGVPFGRLPGDLVYRRGGLTVYLPIATSVEYCADPRATVCASLSPIPRVRSEYL